MKTLSMFAAACVLSFCSTASAAWVYVPTRPAVVARPVVVAPAPAIVRPAPIVRPVAPVYRPAVPARRRAARHAVWHAIH